MRLQKTFWEASPLCCGSGSGSGPRGASDSFAASSAKGSQRGAGVHTRPAAHVCVRGAHSALSVRVAMCTRVRVSCFPPASGSAWPESRLRAGGWQGDAAGPGEALGSISPLFLRPHTKRGSEKHNTNTAYFVPPGAEHTRELSRDAVVKNPVSRGPEAWGMRSSLAASSLTAEAPSARRGDPALLPAGLPPGVPASPDPPRPAGLSFLAAPGGSPPGLSAPLTALDGSPYPGTRSRLCPRPPAPVHPQLRPCRHARFQPQPSIPFPCQQGQLG